MRGLSKSDRNHPPASQRLVALSGFDADQQAAIARCLARPQRSSARQNIVACGDVLPPLLALLEGWAYRWCVLADGRRQIIQILLPGDIVGASPARLPEVHNLTALTSVAYSVASPSLPQADGDHLAQAVGVSRAWQERFLHRQITRLGRMSAHERVVDWLLEIRDRLQLAGCDGDEMLVPLTQEMMADALGLTSVHINRTLQSLRRSRLLEFERGRVTFLDHSGCEMMIGERN